MPLYIDDFIKILAELCEERNLKVAVSESAKGALVTGVSAFVGGLLMGPVGLAVGGAVGGGLSAVYQKDKFQPVAVVLMQMSSSQKKKLYDRVSYAFRDFGPVDLLALSTLALSQVQLKDVAIGVVKSFLNNELNLKVLE